jgi:hypothetical protein
MKWFAAFLLLAFPIFASCGDDDTASDPSGPADNGNAEQIAHEQAIAERFAPLLVFDQDQGKQKHRCFPMDAGYWFEVRKTLPYTPDCEPACIIENMDYVSIFQGNVPAYYQYASCDSAEYIAYWFFYGYQPDCDVESGEHSADWEHVIVKIVDGQLARVLFFQHAGQYTKEAASPALLLSEDHPYVFVGAQSHGSYHDTGGSGGCCYWRDWRYPGPLDSWKTMKTWMNLVRLSRDDDSPEWMKCATEECWPNCCPGPLHRDTDFCDLQACVGTDPTCDLTGDNQQGCQRTDVWGRF